MLVVVLPTCVFASQDDDDEAPPPPPRPSVGNVIRTLVVVDPDVALFPPRAIPLGSGGRSEAFISL